MTTTTTITLQFWSRNKNGQWISKPVVVSDADMKKLGFKKEGK